MPIVHCYAYKSFTLGYSFRTATLNQHPRWFQGISREQMMFVCHGERSVPVSLSTADHLLDVQLAFPMRASTQMSISWNRMSFSSMISNEVSPVLANFLLTCDDLGLWVKHISFSWRLWHSIKSCRFVTFRPQRLKHSLKEKVIFHTAVSGIRVPFAAVNRVVGFSSEAPRTRRRLTCLPFWRKNIKKDQHFYTYCRSDNKATAVEGFWLAKPLSNSPTSVEQSVAFLSILKSQMNANLYIRSATAQILSLFCSTTLQIHKLLRSSSGKVKGFRVYLPRVTVVRSKKTTNPQSGRKPFTVSMR